MKKYFLPIFLFCSCALSAQNWTQSNDTLLDGVYVRPEFIFHNSQQWMLGSYDRLYSFNNLNQSWQDADNGILPTHMNLVSMAQTGDTAYLNTYYSELYRSTDGGQNWTQITPTGLPSSFSGLTLATLDPSSNRIFMFGSGIYTSTDGINWTAVPVTNTPYRLGANYFYWITPAGDSVTILDNQLNYTTINRPDLNSYTTSTYSRDGQYAFGWDRSGGGIYRLPLYVPNAPWTQIGTLPDDTIGSAPVVYYDEGKFQVLYFCYTNPSTNNISMRPYISLDSGFTWTFRRDMHWMNYSTFFTPIAQDTLMADDNTGAIRISTDGGSTWLKWENHARALNYLNAYQAPQLDTILGNFRIDGSIANLGMLRSIDGGISWEIVNSGLPYSPLNYDSTLARRVYAKPYKQGSSYFTICDDGVSLYRSFDGGSNWQQSPHPNVNIMNDMGGDDDTHFLWTYIYSTDVQNVYRSDDAGNTWNIVNLPLADTANHHYGGDQLIQALNDTFLFSFTQFVSSFPLTKVFYSTDNANTWSEITPTVCVNRTDKRLQILSDANVNPVPRAVSFGENANKLMVVVETRDTTSADNYYNPPPVVYDSLYLWENNTWSQVNFTGLPAGLRMQQLTWFSGAWYLSSDMGVYSSTDDGATWSTSGLRTGDPAQHALTNNGLRLGMKMYSLGVTNNAIVSTTSGGGVWRFNTTPLQLENRAPLTNSLQVFPVPAGNGSIQWTSAAWLQKPVVNILDAQGRIVLSKPAVSGFNGSIDVSGLESGVYMLEIIDGARVQRNRFVIAY